MSQQRKLSGGRRSSPSRKRFHILLHVILPLFLVTLCITLITIFWYNTRPQIATNPFVTKSGTTLMVNGSPLRLIGYNWHWMGTDCPTPTNTEIDATFSQIVTASHGNVIRTAFYQSGSNDGAYIGFDRYVKYAKRYKLY